jgi:hypothetical protein
MNLRFSPLRLKPGNIKLGLEHRSKQSSPKSGQQQTRTKRIGDLIYNAHDHPIAASSHSELLYRFPLDLFIE